MSCEVGWYVHPIFHDRIAASLVWFAHFGITLAPIQIWITTVQLEAMETRMMMLLTSRRSYAIFPYILLFFLFPTHSHATDDCGTTVDYTMIVGETWTTSGSPYCIDVAVQIASLTINPGVTVKFRGDYSFEVLGTLIAIGTEQDSITFTRPDSVSGWQGIYFHDAGEGSELAYCTIEKSKNSGVRIVDSVPPSIDHCTFASNSASQGGGLNISISSLPESELILSDCTFKNNSSSSHGGALKVHMTDGAVTIIHSTFQYNTANPSNANGDYVAGAFYLPQGDATISRCLFVGNRSNARCKASYDCDVIARGGAIYIGSSGSAEFTNCSFVANRTNASNGSNPFWSGSSSRSYGAGIYVATGSVTISNAIFTGNSCTATNNGRHLAGGGIYVNSGAVTAINNIIVENNDATGVHGAGGTLDIMNSIIYLNNGEGTQVSGSCTITYSDIQGGYEGEGNIQLHPIYDEEYQIVSGSPCIDAGNPLPSYNDLCRPPSLGSLSNDMGAYGGPDACGWLNTAWLDPPPAPPSAFSAEVEVGQIVLTWSANADHDLLEYRLYRDTASEATTLLATIPAGTETYSDTDILPETFYYYRLTAVDEAEQESAYSIEVVAKADDVTPPDAPIGLMADGGDGFTSLTWAANTEDDLALYRIYRNTQATPTTPIDSVSAGVESYVDDSVTNGMTYYYCLTAVDDGGNESAYSDTVSAYPDIPRADLAVALTAYPLSPGAGDTLTLTAQLTNVGPEVAQGVTVSFTVPAELSFISATPEANYDPSTGAWSVGELAGGEVDTLIVYMRVDTSGVFVCSVEVVASDLSDPVASNDMAEVEVRTHDTDLGLTMFVDQENPIAGEEIIYTLTLTNHGPSNADGAAVGDTLALGLTFRGASSSQGSYSQQSGTWSVGSLDLSASATLSLTARVDSLGEIANTAWITESNLPDLVASNDSARVIVDCSWADLSLEYAASDTLPPVGGAFDLTLRLYNAGPHDTEEIEVLCSVPLGIRFSSVTASSGNFDTGSGIWSLASLAEGTHDSLEIAAIIDSVGAISCSAEITASSLRDSNASDDVVSVIISGQAADLALASTVDVPFPDVEDDVSITVTVVNHGPSTASSVVIHDALPNGLALTATTPSQGSYNEGTADWSVGDLTSGANATLTLDVTVATFGVFINQAYVVPGELPDLVAANDSTSVVVNSEHADLSISLNVDESQPVLNDVVLLTITVTNNGPNAALGVMVEDIPPAGLNFTSRSTSQGSVVDNTWTIGTLAAGANATWLIDATVTSEALITNTAEITASEQADRNASNNSATISIDSRSNHPPEIAHTPSTWPWSVGVDQVVTATITDRDEVATAELHYRRGRGTLYTPLTMEWIGGDDYEATIPGGEITSWGVEYYITASDEEPLEGISDSYSPPVAISNLVRSEAQPAGSEQDSYRLVSFPLNLTDPDPGSALADDLGSYNKCRWRFFELSSSQDYIEHPETEDVTAGHGYWLIVRDSGQTLGTGAATSVSLVEEFAIDLHAGWTFIGNPFSFPLPQSALHRFSGGALDIRACAGSWSTHSDSLYPFEGYAIFANESDQLLINPDLTSTPLVGTRSPAADARAWAIRVAAQVQRAQDNDNVALASVGALPGWDRLDRAEPPIIGEYVSVYFAHPAGEGPTRRLCVDARPEPANGVVWDLDVVTNITDRVLLRFAGLDEVPGRFQIRLLDDRLGISQDLRALEIYELTPMADGEERYALRLVVGTAAFLEGEIDLATTVPVRYELAPAVPNPCHPLATIRYGLPHSERVTLQIYNVLGEVIATLVPGEPRAAGQHVAVWNGRDQSGCWVNPGVYFYALQVEGQGTVRRQKLILVR